MSVITVPLLGEGRWNQDPRKPVLGLQNTAEVRKFIKVRAAGEAMVSTFISTPLLDPTHDRHHKASVFLNLAHFTYHDGS